MASTIFTLALAPMRVAPAAVMACTSCSVRMPPEAFTPIFGPTAARISAMSCAVAPEVEKPVEVLTKSAPAALQICAGHGLLRVVEQRRFQNHFDDGAGLVRHPHHGLNVVLHGIGIAGPQRARR